MNINEPEAALAPLWKVFRVEFFNSRTVTLTDISPSTDKLFLMSVCNSLNECSLELGYAYFTATHITNK